MRKLILLLCLTCIITPAHSKIYQNYHYQTESKEILDKTFIENLAYSENQIFKQIYPGDEAEQRIERLELAVYGAIQNGNIKKRIKKIKKSVTNITDGGYGLQYANKLFDLTGSNSRNGYWSIGNIPKSFSDYKPHFHSNRIYHPKCCSHRLPSKPPRHYNAQRTNPIINGNTYTNYSMKTGIHILDD